MPIPSAQRASGSKNRSGTQILSNSLRSGIESKKYDMERTQAALSKTLNITAYDSARLVGCLRILTDGYFFGTITELLVLPEYQKQGVGSKLLELAKENTLTIEQEIPKWTSCFFVIQSKKRHSFCCAVSGMDFINIACIAMCSLCGWIQFL